MGQCKIERIGWKTSGCNDVLRRMSVLITLVAEPSCGGQPEIGRGNEATAVLPTTPASFSFCSTKEHPVIVETPDESSLPEPTTSAGFF
jgi:hypothetical protein